MIYTVIASNGQSYDLPPKTINIMEKLDKVLKVDSEKGLSIRQKYQKIFDFVVELLSKEVAAEILGGQTLNDVDMGELELLVLKIQDSYNDAISEYRAEKLRDSFDSIPADKLKALTEIGKAISK